MLMLITIPGYGVKGAGWDLNTPYVNVNLFKFSINSKTGLNLNTSYVNVNLRKAVETGKLVAEFKYILC